MAKEESKVKAIADDAAVEVVAVVGTTPPVAAAKADIPTEISIGTKVSGSITQTPPAVQTVTFGLDPAPRTDDVVLIIGQGHNLYPILKRQFMTGSFQHIELTIRPDWSIKLKYVNVTYSDSSAISVGNVTIDGTAESIALTQGTADLLSIELNKVVSDARVKKAASLFLENESNARLNAARKLLEGTFKVKATDDEVAQLSALIG